MQQVGVTQSGQRVVAGLGPLYYRDGIPPSLIFDACRQRGLQPSFPHLFAELASNGMSKERILHLLHEHVFESYGKEIRDTVIARLT